MPRGQAGPGPCGDHLGRPRRSRRRRRGTFCAHGVRPIRAQCPSTTIEILTPDFLRKDGALEVVAAAKPDVFNHNLETVPSRYLSVRPGARYFHSIRLLQRVKEIDPTIFTKSEIMVGLGEERHEVLQVMDDLRSANVDFLHHRSISAADPQASRGDALRGHRMNFRAMRRLPTPRAS